MFGLKKQQDWQIRGRMRGFSPGSSAAVWAANIGLSSQQLAIWTAFIVELDSDKTREFWAPKPWIKKRLSISDEPGGVRYISFV